MNTISFVLSGIKLSGGTLNTIHMGNHLIDKGYDVRILYRDDPHKLTVKSLFKKLTGPKWFQKYDVLGLFKGPSYPYRDLNKIDFKNNELVVAQGAYTVKDVYSIKSDVFKMRHCRGFSSFNDKLMKEAWGGPMPTITVASTLIPQLEKYSGNKVLGVVPNGKDFTKFYCEDLTRDGVGVLIYDHPNKRFNDIQEVLIKLHNLKPELKFYAFGKIQKPKKLPFLQYSQLPEIDKIREIYNKSLVWFSTSKDEGLPNPILEAMACGAAVVSADNLGARELIKDSINGYLVPIGDIEQITNKICQLIENPDLRNIFAKESLVTIKKYTWENAVNAMEDALEKLVTLKAN